jgi:glycosyltransferase involved in cell wall biosynthesis
MMKILILCSKSPYPPTEGGPIAMNAIIEGLLKEGHTVKVLAMESWKFPIDKNKIPEEYLKKTDFETVFVDLKIKPFKAFLNLFTGRSYHVERFISSSYKNKLTEILNKESFDVVQLETLYISPYLDIIRKYSDAKIILRSHNIEHKIWERVSENKHNPLKKLYLRHLTNTLRRYELMSMIRFDGVATISAVDEEFLRDKGYDIPIKTIGFGIDLENLPSAEKESDFPGIFHLGSMNWIPNQEGIRWFLENVWHEVIKLKPECELYLAGRHMPDWLLKSDFPNVKVVGEVESAYDFINSKSIMVVPLFSGSGIRIKIIEGMALGKTIISTKTGADGIMYENMENIIIADTADEFIKAIVQCSDNKEFSSKLGKKAKDLIEKEHNNKIIIRKLLSFYQSIISQHTESPVL